MVKRYSIRRKFSEHSLFLRASASCSKILNVKSVFNRVKNFRGSCFQGKRKLLKILNVRSIFNTVKKFRATLIFQGKRKFLENREQ